MGKAKIQQERLERQARNDAMRVEREEEIRREKTLFFEHEYLWLLGS